MSMRAADLSRVVRGHATVRLRGTVLFLQPLVLALIVWGVTLVVRLSDGPIPVGLALLGLAGPLVWLPLCVAPNGPAATRRTQAPPSLSLLASRFSVLAIAVIAIFLVFAWLTPRHD